MLNALLLCNNPLQREVETRMRAPILLLTAKLICFTVRKEVQD